VASDENMQRDSTSKVKYKGITYSNLAALLVKGMQEQQDMIDKLEKKLGKLEKELELIGKKIKTHLFQIAKTYA